MTGIDSWSVTPAENATADGGSINWAEGQAPSTVNNTARQMLTDTRNAFNDLAWFQYGTGSQNTGTHLAVPAVYASATSFTIAGADVTAAYHIGRRVRAVGATTTTIYGTISLSAYAPTTTTVTVVWDSGSLANETLVISLSQLPLTGAPTPAVPRFRVYRGTSNQTGIASGTNTAIVFNTATYDAATLVSLSTGVMTVNKAGLWHFDAAAVGTGALNATAFAVISLFKNGTIYSSYEVLTGNTAVTVLTISADIPCAATDTIDVRVSITTTSSTASVNFAASGADTWWNGRWVSP